MSRQTRRLIPIGVAPNSLVYTATKGAIEQISRILAKDPAIGAKGITVNTVSPGPVDTPLLREGKPQQLIETLAKLAPPGRLGEVDDIAPVVSFLASPAAQWVNGQNLRVNGVRTTFLSSCVIRVLTRTCRDWFRKFREDLLLE
jgi:NAD(P)-dependent dehydrogenase (short-subunit alcohol dehydrogenase family)